MNEEYRKNKTGVINNEDFKYKTKLFRIIKNI